MIELTTDVAVIGAGTAGMGAYRAALRHTNKVLLIEADRYGTTCARVGCMPSKLLIAAAEAAEAVRQAPMFGVSSDGPHVDGRAVMRRVREERDRFVGFVERAVEAWPKAERLIGTAHFIDRHTLSVGDHTRIKAQRIVIATGSRPRVPDGWREEIGDRLLVNDDVFEWHDLPASAAVVGSGAIGLELAQALSRLGVRVSLFGRDHKLVFLSDERVAAHARTLMHERLDYSEDAQQLVPSRHGDQVRIAWVQDGRSMEERFDYLICATGRISNLDRLNIASADLPMDDMQRLLFDRGTCQIGDTSVFIAGDVHGRSPILHEAADDARIAGDNAGRWPDVRVHPRRAKLGIVFSDPQIAVVGDRYLDMVAQGIDVAAGELNWATQGRAQVMARNAGLLRVYGDRKDGRFLGAEMIGPNAEHIAHLLAWSLQQRMSVQQMLEMPFYHPVLEEGLRTALRHLRRELKMGPDPVTSCLDCGPGA